MISFDDKEIMIRMLESQSTDLISLARITNRDEFSFYRGADLSGLDLSEQDLRGLNFDGADLTNSELDGCLYDLGAFNNSMVDEKQSYLKDEFDFYLSDLFSHKNDEILIFCKIRPSLIEDCITALAMPFNEFSERSGVSTNAVRKARRGEVVAIETATKIFSAYFDISRKNDKKILIDMNRKVQQPIISFVYGGYNGGFTRVSPVELKELFEKRKFLADYYRNSPLNILSTLRDTPEYIMSSYRMVVKGRQRTLNE